MYFMRCLSAILPLAILAPLSGCTLPAITQDVVLLENAEVPGSLIPLPLFAVPVPVGGTCNLPSEEELQELVRNEVPAFLRDWVVLENVDLQSITFAVTEGSIGNFGSLNEVTVDVVLVNASDVETERYTLSTVESSTGFGDAVELNVSPAADIIAILRDAPDCAGLAVTVSGATPTEDVTFDASVRVRVVARLIP